MTERKTDRPTSGSSTRSPGRLTRVVGLLVLTVIVVVLLAMWVISGVEGDPTNHLEERQPSPSSASPS